MTPEENKDFLIMKIETAKARELFFAYAEILGKMSSEQLNSKFGYSDKYQAIGQNFFQWQKQIKELEEKFFLKYPKLEKEKK